MLLIALLLFIFGATMLISNVKELLRHPSADTFEVPQTLTMPRFYRLKH